MFGEGGGAQVGDAQVRGGGEQAELGVEADGEALVVGRQQDAGPGVGAGEADGAVEGDDGLAGAGASGDASGAGEVVIDEGSLRGVEPDRPFLPRRVEGAGELVGIDEQTEAALGVGVGERVGRQGRGGGLDTGGEIDEGLERLGREVPGKVEQGVVGGGADVGDPVGGNAAEQERRLGRAGEESGLRGRDGHGNGNFLNSFADFHELGGTGRRMGLEPATLSPGVGGVVVANPGEEGVPCPFVQDDAQVAGGAGGPEVLVAGAVDAVEGKAGGARVHLQVEGGLLRGRLLRGGQVVEGGGEGVGCGRSSRENIPDFAEV